MHKVSLFIVLLLMAGCVAPTYDDVRYPAEISGLGDSPNFPLFVVGFERGKVMTYAPDMQNISIGYNLYSSQSHIASTIYLYASEAEDLDRMFETEKQNVMAAHEGATLLNTRELTIVKDGIEHRGLEATFQFQGLFMKKQQALFSQLLLFYPNGKFVKLRSTSPIEESYVTTAKNMELMDVLGWAPKP